MKATQEGLTRKEVVFKLLTHVFLCARQHHWYRILPSDGIDPDITHATEVKWEYLLPMLTYIGLISWKVTSMVKECIVEDNQWDIFKQAIEKHGMMHLSTIFIQKTRVRFFCIGKPIYSGPLKQIRAKAAIICLRGSLGQRELGIDVQKQAKQLIARRQYNRTMRKDQSIIDVDGNEDNEKDNDDDVSPDIIDRIAIEVERQIKVAENLDLNLRPRLSRANHGKFGVVEKK